MAKSKRQTKTSKSKQAQNYRHPESESPMRPDVGTQAQFKKKLPPKKFRYDDSLSPSLEWDGQNPAREIGEAHIAVADSELRQLYERLAPKQEIWPEVADHVGKAQEAVRKLKAMSKPFLNWAGKAERLSFDVPTLPLFIHERLSTKAILETLKGHRRDKQIDMFDLFGDPQHPIHDQILRAYEHMDKWVNRMILGDSLVVMNSLLQYEGLGGQVQMIYLDPPYGVQFGSNFQPFVRNRDVKHNDDEDMTREPEMIQAYRDTWELGLHSYLTYLRDRLMVARELLTPSGSIFVQISDENIHHVREVMDEVFRSENAVALVTFLKTTSATGDEIGTVADYLLWYAKDKEHLRFQPVYRRKEWGDEGTSQYIWLQVSDGTTYRRLTAEELANPTQIPRDAKIFAADNCTSSRDAGPNEAREIRALGERFPLRKGSFKTHPDGFKRLESCNRLVKIGSSLMYK